MVGDVTDNDEGQGRSVPNLVNIEVIHLEERRLLSLTNEGVDK